MRYVESMWRIFTFLVLVFWTPSAQAQEFKLSWPVACTLGEDCWVQQYVDHDAGAGVADFTCGSASYDGHDGTDIRVLDTKRTADVLAAADGTVKAVRDGEVDQLVRTETDKQRVRNKECGNGVVIDHGDGNETQYCHLKLGSLRVVAGDVVKAGAVLGQVGYSGEAGFPHLHMTLRKSGVARDPFSDATAGDCTATDNSLWAAPVPYEPEAILHAGFHSGPVALEALEAGAVPLHNPRSDWPALVAYLWAVNLKQGDVVVVDVAGPDGFAARNEATLDRYKAQYMLFAGKKQPPGGFAPGEYVARLAVLRGGKAVLMTEVMTKI